MKLDNQWATHHFDCFSRRRFLASAGVLTAGTCLLPRQLLAETKDIVQMALKHAESAKITVQPLRGNVSALIGSGGNIAVLTGPDGKLIVDAGYSTSRARIAEALAKLSSEPIKHLVNTHWHFDHTDGNEWMHSEGAAILAHENTRKHLSTTTRVEAWDHTFPPSPAGAIPAEVFDKKQNAASEWRHDCARLLRTEPYRRRSIRLFCRGGRFSLRRHLVERSLPVHRLLYRRQY